MSWIYNIFRNIKTYCHNFIFLHKNPCFKTYHRWTGKFMGYMFNEYDSINEGWRIAFGEQLCRDLNKTLKQVKQRIKEENKSKPRKKRHSTKTRDLFMFVDIKDKYGSLRLSATTTEELQKVLDYYELLSYGYCMHCGKPVRYITHGWWIEYLCEDCYDKYLNVNSTATKIQKRSQKKKDRLKAKDIPCWETFDSEKQKFVKIDSGIDFYDLWDIKRKNTQKLVDLEKMEKNK